MAGTDNTLTIKFDKDTTLPLLEGLGKSAYAIAVAHGFQGTEQDWLNSLRGPKGDPGDKGDPFKFSDFTPEQLNSLKGKPGDKGDPGSADNAALELKKIGIYLADNSVDTVLTALIKNVRSAVSFMPKPLAFEQPAAGATYIDFTGEPHFKLSINGGEKREFQSDNMRVAIDSTMKGTIKVDYYDLVDNLESTHQITITTKEASVIEPSVNMGAFVREVPLHSNTYNNKMLGGTAKIYSNGILIVPTLFKLVASAKEQALQDCINNATNRTLYDTVEVNFTGLSKDDCPFGVMDNKINNTDAYTNYLNTLIIKVNKSQIATQYTQDVGKSDTIQFPGSEDKKIKINNSDLITMKDEDTTYTYSFTTGEITSSD